MNLNAAKIVNLNAAKVDFILYGNLCDTAVEFPTVNLVP